MSEVKLFQGDCLKVMQDLIDDDIKVDLVVTSPPYDNLRTYNDSLNWDFDIFKQVADKLYQIVGDGGVIVWVVNDAHIDGSETGTSFRQALYFKEIGFNLHDTMIYQKVGLTQPPTFNRYYPYFEFMFILSKGKPLTTNLIKDRLNKCVGEKVSSSNRNKKGELIDSNAKKQGRLVKKYGVRFNIWQYGQGYGKSAKNPIAFEHPAIFPLDLAKDHILSWSNPNDIVLDPFMGSGTTGVACLQTNRNFIGIEKVEKYFKIAEQRIKEANEQRRLV